MYWRGHVGIALLAYAPVAGATLTVGEPGLTLLGGGLSVAVATLPDVDQQLPGPHRGPTHTLAFAFAAGLLAGVLAAVALAGGAGHAIPGWTPAFVGGTVTLSLCSHIAGDAITPMGIRPFRPLSTAHYTLDLMPAKNPRANRIFLVAGLLSTAVVVGVAY
ncbi:metal-dependent hydrolase [Halorubrum sp. AD140]|uniref:metal-dependent hydrolase n=1 Tax=Halorubrum sp. AD140 TaxID=3050073 RepID=UPI002ACD177A|nr:metal-dependent hydrolase [Halorubrum sp. AD140]MDZ5811036.1 metal-dependent hydrolase [Halorubrum sp. AD140]